MILYNNVVSIVPTSHHMTTNAGNTGMKEVRMPLSSVRSENTVMEVLRPQVSDTRPARKVPRANLPRYSFIIVAMLQIATVKCKVFLSNTMKASLLP